MFSVVTSVTRGNSVGSNRNSGIREQRESNKMGTKRRVLAEARREAQKTTHFAKLNNVPTSPRKICLIANMIRGMEVSHAPGVLEFSNKEAVTRVKKLLRSTIVNWEQRGGRKAGVGELCISSISVDCAITLKRMRPVSQGRDYRIRRYSDYVTLFVDTLSRNDGQNQLVNETEG